MEENLRRTKASRCRRRRRTEGWRSSLTSRDRSYGKYGSTDTCTTSSTRRIYCNDNGIMVAEKRPHPNPVKSLTLEISSMIELRLIKLSSKIYIRRHRWLMNTQSSFFIPWSSHTPTLPHSPVSHFHVNGQQITSYALRETFFFGQMVAFEFREEADYERW